MKTRQRFAAFLRRNKLFAAVLAAEAAVLLYLAAGLFGAPYKLTLTPAEFANEFADIAAVSADSGALEVQRRRVYRRGGSDVFLGPGVAGGRRV